MDRGSWKFDPDQQSFYMTFPGGEVLRRETNEVTRVACDFDEDERLVGIEVFCAAGGDIAQEV